MNPYCYHPNVPAPYLNPLLQVNVWGDGMHSAANANNIPTAFGFIPTQSPTTYFGHQQSPTPQPLPPAAFSPETTRANALTSTPESPPGGSSPHNLQFRRNVTDNDRSAVADMENLMDANLAGSEYSSECTLILTEGKAAMSLAAAGLSEVGRDVYGLYAVERRLINVCKVPEDGIENNSEIKNIKKILGLRSEFQYETDEEMKTLRYGKVLFMMDRDEDGSHMKGLFMIFFYKLWPSLLRKHRFLKQFILPVVKVWSFSGGYNEKFFYTHEEHENWKSQFNTSDSIKVFTRYYKSLESFTPQEVKGYFSDLLGKSVHFRYENIEDDLALTLAFEKGHEDSRKCWISDTLRESFSSYEDMREIRYKDFINKELLCYSDLQNLRSFPSAIDGLTRSQRKVLHAYLKRHLEHSTHSEQEVSVLRLIGSVFDVSAYKQSMDALSQTIINMAQDFVGANNINILMPIGQFGSRIHGGRDAGKAKYLYTKLNSIMKYIFSEQDFPILSYREESGMSVEPNHYLPIIPMILVNGSEGIGTGWKTKIPKYNPVDIIKNLFLMLDGSEPAEMKPYFKGFKGEIKSVGINQFETSGVILVLESNQIRITELPIDLSIEAYKEKVLNPLQKRKDLRYEEYHTDTSVDFLVTLLRQDPRTIPTIKLYDMFRLKSIEKYSFVAIDRRGVVKGYDNTIEILKEYYDVRLSGYASRKDYMGKQLEWNLKQLEELYRNILYNHGSLINLQGGIYNYMYDASRIQGNIKVLEKDIEKTKEQLEQLQGKSPEDLWGNDLKTLYTNLERDNDFQIISLMDNLNV